jgi:peptidoglycan/LPS O-acetylase OafA/YrhL
MFRCLNFVSVFKSQKRSNNFDFLDGYRGFLVLTVIAHHFDLYFEIINGIGYRIGVLGFFMLSAYLLTYRLLIDFDAVATHRDRFIIILQYFIRRLFRIYLPFIIFWTVFRVYIPSYIGGLALHRAYTEHYWDGLFLQFNHWPAHLWTIPVEIKYYFLIPVICLIVSILRKQWHVCCLGIVAFILIIEFYNPFGNVFSVYNGYDKNTTYYRNFSLMEFLVVFLKGSLIAILNYGMKMQNINCEPSGIYHRTLCAITLTALLYQYRYALYVKELWNPNDIISEYLGFIVLLSMILGAPNYFTTIFDNIILRSIGKYSYGIYLLHVLGTLLYMNHLRPSVAPLINEFIPVIFICYILGMIWFYCVENVLLKVASWICKKIYLHFK